MSDDLIADCSRCAALCCVLPAFDKSDSFGHDKPALTICKHLGRDDRCAIHDDLAGRGYGGCVAFDCHGAGPTVLHDVFGGVSWRQAPAEMARMSAAFLSLRRINRLRLLLFSAATLVLDPARETRRLALATELEPQGKWTETALRAFDIDKVEQAVEAFLRSLRDVAVARRPGPASRDGK